MKILISLAGTIVLLGGSVATALPVSASPDGSCGIGEDVKALNESLHPEDHLGQVYGHEAGGAGVVLQGRHDAVKEFCHEEF